MWSAGDPFLNTSKWVYVIIVLRDSDGRCLATWGVKRERVAVVIVN